MPALRSIGFLCRGFPLNLPAGKNQNSRMTLQRPRQNLGTLHAKVNPVVLNG